MDKIFATHGIPTKLKSDNGPPFNGKEFENYVKTLGIDWKPSLPLWPQGNENAESIMRPTGKVMKTSILENKTGDNNSKDFYLTTVLHLIKQQELHLVNYFSIDKFMDNYHNYKRRSWSTSIVKQSEILRGRKRKVKCITTKKKKAKYSDIKVGDTVICLQKKFNKLTPRFSPEMLVVTERAGSKVTAESQD